MLKIKIYRRAFQHLGTVAFLTDQQKFIIGIVLEDIILKDEPYFKNALS